jgi:PAS domain S-box-containing protein
VAEGKVVRVGLHRPGEGTGISHIFVLLAVFWTVCVMASYHWNQSQTQRSLEQLAEAEARSSFDKDAVYRRWVTLHGGVYVPVTEATPPNPFLDHLPYRDVTTAAGQDLTLLNPAYMTRQVHELGQELYGLRGHITSLDPLRPENAPDPWEAEALRAFEDGEQEVLSLELVDGEQYLRFMRPFVADAGCLKCHGHQGYEVGDIRGGISVSTPISHYTSAAMEQRAPLLAAHLLLGLCGLLGLFASDRLLRRSRRRLLRNEEKYRSTVESISDGFFILLGEDLVVDFFNAEAARLLGREAEDVVGRPLFEAFPEAVGSMFEQQYREAYRTGQPAKFEFYFEVQPYRNWFDVRVYPTHGGISVFFQVTTERKQREEAHERVANEWQSTFDAVNDGIWIVSDQHRILRHNAAFGDLFGKSGSELIGEPCRETVHGTSVCDEDCPGLRARRSGVRESADLQLGDRHFHFTVDPIEDGAGQYFRAVHVLRDVTEAHRAEAEHRSMEEQLRQSQKMESVGRLAGGVAHDFNNLLTVIQNYTEMARDDAPVDSPLRDDLQEVLEASGRAAALTRQLLAYSRKQILNPVTLDVNRVVGKMQSMLRRLIREDIELEIVLEDDLDMVLVDRTGLEQVLMNLVVNARDSMPDGGKLTVETAAVDLDDRYAAEHADVRPGRHVLLAVSDNGEGMTPEVRDRVFEPFFTTKEQGKGTGLGLSTVHGIVKQSGGHLWVYSELGRGTTFKVYLPCKSVREESEPDGDVVADLPMGSEVVLVVEDSDPLRQLATRILSSAGYRVLSAALPGDAIRMVEEEPGRVDLLLTDVVMPQMSGKVLAQRLLEVRPDLHILYMSGYTGNAIVHHGVLDHGVRFIAKPFGRVELLGAVRAAIEAGQTSLESGDS